jgi:hypothetical protein
MSSTRDEVPCCGCGALMHFDYLCKGCMQPLHYWESVDYDPTLDEYPHGPHYLCMSCSTKKIPAVLPQKVSQRRASQPIESGSTKKKVVSRSHWRKPVESGSMKRTTEPIESSCTKRNVSRSRGRKPVDSGSAKRITEPIESSSTMNKGSRSPKMKSPVR